MKVTAASAFAILAFTSSAAAQHKHHHARQAKEERRDTLQKRVLEIETVVEYQFITVDEDGNLYEASTSTSYDYEQAVVVVPTTSTPAAAEAVIVPTSSTSVAAAVVPTTSAYSEPPSPSSSTFPTVIASSSSAAQGSSTETGLDATFPDASLECSEFPSQYGAVALVYLGNNGWTGIQLNDADASSCTEGALCSYACPPGYSKSQWPGTQPADGQSRGGLLCQDGKLTLTRPSVSTLCVAGKGTANVVNKMSQNVAVCRTDYPGTENMVIPTNPSGGATLPLTVVVEDDYYTWDNGLTSAQYYVNKAGVSQEDGCIWGTDGSGVGNFAPLVFGAGYTAGASWLALFPNPLANGLDAGYDVAIVAAEGSTTSCTCTFQGGKFYENGLENSVGCTVALTSGTADYVFTERS